MRVMIIGLVIALLALPASAQTETRPAPAQPAEAAVEAAGGLPTGAIIGIALATGFVVVDGLRGFPVLGRAHSYLYRLIYPPPPTPTPAQTMRVMAIIAGSLSGIVVRAYHAVGGSAPVEPAAPVDVNTAVQG